MTHLDESTIHAWLDGALSAADARDAEAHVAVCPECSAKVAEARGFVAGASRILTALDDVPVGVTPMCAPSIVPAVRQWRAAPWVTGIAATLVLAIGIATWKEQQPDFASQRSMPAPAPVVVADSAKVTAPQRSAANPESSAIRRARVAEPARAPQMAAGAASGAGVASVAAAAPRADAEERVAAPVVTLGEVSKKAEAFPVASAMKDAPDEAILTRSRDLEVAGCYRIDVPRAPQLEAAPRAMAARAPAAPSAVPAVVPAVVRLDTTVAARGYVARDIRTGAPFGVWYRTGDSVHVRTSSAVTFTVSAAAKLKCP